MNAAFCFCSACGSVMRGTLAAGHEVVRIRFSFEGGA